MEVLLGRGWLWAGPGRPPPTWVGRAQETTLPWAETDRREIIRRPDAPHVTIAQAGVMTALTTSRPTSQGLARTGERSGRHWFKTVLTALLAGVLCLVLIGFTRTASSLITGGTDVRSTK